MGNNIVGAGNALASGQVGQANAWSSGINNAASGLNSGLMNYLMYNNSSGYDPANYNYTGTGSLNYDPSFWGG